jgi:hypothetical protein
MKKMSYDDPDDDLRPHYDFDFKNMKPNRFAKLKRRRALLLDADVAEVFDSPEAVNNVLRSVIKAMGTATVSSDAKPARKAGISANAAAKRRAS